MKRFAVCLLVLALVLSTVAAAVPAHAADAVDSAMRAYAEIAANAAYYNFGIDPYAEIDTSTYHYALVDIEDGGGIPTLLLSLSVESAMLGYMEYIRVFQYDAADGTVLAPDTVIRSGVAAAGGFRGGVFLQRNKLVSTAVSAMTGQMDIYQYSISDGTLTSACIWSGTIDSVVDTYVMEAINWKEIGDDAVFAPYRYSGALAQTAYVGSRAACAMSAEAARAYADVIRSTDKPVVRAALFDAGGGLPLLWVAWGDDAYIEESGRTVISEGYGDQVYGYAGGQILRFPWMTTLLRAGENGVIVQKKMSYYSDNAEDFSMYRLTGGGIAAAPFATGTFDALNGAWLNGQALVNVSGLTALYQQADPNVQVWLSAESGLADMLFLYGDWSEGAAMRGALLAYAGETSPAAPSNIAYASAQTVSVDGRQVEFQCYALKDEKGNPTNYIKLRDLAVHLNGTPAQFGVDWDGSVLILPHTGYTLNGSELQTPFSGDRAYQDSTAVTKIDGRVVDLAAFMLTDDSGGGYTYYQLRELGKALGFNVGWKPDRGIFVETDRPYDPAD